ncbi:hypothetical protein [Acetilactobacillus jinshanensis]|uniref:Membrane protein 6-pyruvoyl-tetrahydropterin synthase-related domain-containing protein n=1 Tax=Acetilactobacillus jinshanensis TaxID=1720083 RepID=A0A4P6ZL99_9LACO|nr:hypothetical protein [Acetilactobacillus jinshanensis]QBP18448.1 hypothetical protein ELX58_04705 [Acetilactobacillus jinshanensis]
MHIFNSYYQKVTHNKYLFNLSIIISFLLISFVSIICLLHSHIIYGGNGIDGGYDMMFHFQRVEDLSRAIQSGHLLPRLTFNAMSSNGNAVMQFYPYITLYPIAIFFILFRPTISSIYFAFMILVFVGLIISYYSSKSISHNKLISYTFAILYCTSSMIMFYALEAIDLGVLMAMLFLPLAIFGFLNLLHDGSWMELTIGLILLIFSHVLTSLLLIVTLLIWALCDYKKFDVAKIISVAKIFVITVLCTAIWWLPCLYLMMKNNLRYPRNFDLVGATDIVHLITVGLHDNIQMSDMISFFAVIGLILSLVFWKKLDDDTKGLAFVSITTLILTTGILPWSQLGVAPWIILARTPLAILQFCWRLDVIPELCLMYIASVCLVKYLNIRKLVVPAVIILAVILQINNQFQVLNSAKGANVLPINRYIFHRDRIKYSKNRYYINRDSQLKYVLRSRTSASTIPDYYPAASQPMNLFISESNGSYLGVKTVHFRSLNNGYYNIHVKPNAIYNLNLPIVKYNGIRYQIYLGNKRIHSSYGKDHLLVTKVLHHGYYKLHIKVIYPHIINASKYLTILGFLIFIAYFVMAELDYRKEGRLSD